MERTWNNTTNAPLLKGVLNANFKRRCLIASDELNRQIKVNAATNKKCSFGRNAKVQHTEVSGTLATNSVNKPINPGDDLSGSSVKPGVDRNLEVEQILSLEADELGKMVFIIKLKGSDVPDMMPARVANVKIPEMVLSFYINRLSEHDFISTLFRETW